MQEAVNQRENSQTNQSKFHQKAEISYAIEDRKKEKLLLMFSSTLFHSLTHSDHGSRAWRVFQWVTRKWNMSVLPSGKSSCHISSNELPALLLIITVQDHFPGSHVAQVHFKARRRIERKKRRCENTRISASSLMRCDLHSFHQALANG